MAKRLAIPLLLVAPQYANRLDITGFTVDAQALTVTIHSSASREVDGSDRVMLEYPDKVLDEAASKRLMADTTRQIVTTALTQLGIDARVIRSVDAALAADLDLSQGLYYAATRDQLYERVG